MSKLTDLLETLGNASGLATKAKRALQDAQQAEVDANAQYAQATAAARKAYDESVAKVRSIQAQVKDEVDSNIGQQSDDRVRL